MAHLGTGAPLHGPPHAPAPPSPFFPLWHPFLDEPNHGMLGHGGSFAWLSARASDECTSSSYPPLQNSVIKITSLSPTVMSTCVSMPPDHLFPPPCSLFGTCPSMSQTMARLGMGAPLHGPLHAPAMNAPALCTFLCGTQPSRSHRFRRRLCPPVCPCHLITFSLPFFSSSAPIPRRVKPWHAWAWGLLCMALTAPPSWMPPSLTTLS